MRLPYPLVSSQSMSSFSLMLSFGFGLEIDRVATASPSGSSTLNRSTPSSRNISSSSSIRAARSCLTSSFTRSAMVFLRTNSRLLVFRLLIDYLRVNYVISWLGLLLLGFEFLPPVGDAVHVFFGPLVLARPVPEVFHLLEVIPSGRDGLVSLDLECLLILLGLTFSGLFSLVVTKRGVRVRGLLHFVGGVEP